jgi:hypothetical protein
MAAKNGLSYEQHKQVGAMLKTIRADLQGLFVQVANAYSRRGSGAAAITALARALDKIGIARSALEDLAVFDCGPRFHTRIYYGSGETAAKGTIEAQ